MNRQMASSELPATRSGKPSRGVSLPRGVVMAAGVVMALQWVALGAWAFSWLTNESQGTEGMPPLGHDLRVFWTVSWITTHLGASAAFDNATLDAAQRHFFPDYTELGHWLYPPTFQWLIQPLSRLSYGWVYALYVIVSVALFVVAVRRWRVGAGWPWLVVMAFPGLWIAILAGQNSVVTLLLMTVALTSSGASPVFAGLCAGLLVIKPQFAVLLPLWWLCARQWRALMTMAATAALCCALTLTWEGWSLWRAFFVAVAAFNAEVVQRGAGDIWHAMPTVFAAARLAGMPLPVAYSLYALVAVPSVLVAAWLWVKRGPLPLRVAAAMTATLLVQPYLLYYELVWLIVPLLCLAQFEASSVTNGRQTWLAGRLQALLWLLPLQAYLAVLWTPMGQWGVVLLPALMWLIGWRAIRAVRSQRAQQASCAHNVAHRL